MRKLMMVVALVAVLVPLLGAAAFATNQIIRCTGLPCTATGTDDLVYERARNGLNDEIHLKGGHDQVRANGYTSDRDEIYGGRGHDLIRVNDGDTLDKIRAGDGPDTCYVDARREAVSGCATLRVR
jgi:hypothetical protein